MSHGEKRKFIRWDSLHLLDYIVTHDDGKVGRYSMGRTLDVSINGIKLETIYSLATAASLEITVGVEEDLIDLEARITYTHESGDRFISGLEFMKMSPEGRRVLRRYIDAFHEQQKKTGADS